MSNASEYGEPWRVEDGLMETASGYIIGEGEYADRIIACINACAGIPTSEIASPLRWRKEPPIAPGWYITYTPSNESFDVVQIYQSGGGPFAPLLAATADGRAYEFLPECKLPGKRLWAGQIERPDDA